MQVSIVEAEGGAAAGSNYLQQVYSVSKVLAPQAECTTAKEKLHCF